MARSRNQLFAQSDRSSLAGKARAVHWQAFCHAHHIVSCLVEWDMFDPVDDIDFSDDFAATWTYDPVDSGNGTDPNITHIRVNPKGTMAPASGPSPASFQILFKVLID